jgi:flagellar protein FliS
MPTVADYLENQVLTASPHRLHLMVVDGAIRFARLGAAALEECRWEALGAALGRSRSCVSEMISGLDGEQSPELAERWKSLFVFVYRNLTVAELERNSQRISDAIRILELHRETWMELGLKLRGESTGSSTPMAGPHGRSWST